MDHHAARRRRALVGVAAMAIGSAGLVGSFAGTAAAHEGTEPEKVHENLSCPDLAELVGSDQEWTEFKIEDFPTEEGEYDYVLSDRGTPDDTSDDAVVTLEVTGPKNFQWTSNVGIDLVFVKGGNAETHGSYYYFYDGEEKTEDEDYTVPPYGQEQNDISHISFCWDDEHTPPSSTSTTEATTTSTTMPEEPTTTSSSTSSTVAPTTSSSVVPTTETPPSSEATTTTVSSGGGLPVTGSNTGLVAAIGGGLLLAGGVFLLARQQLWRRSA